MLKTIPLKIQFMEDGVIQTLYPTLIESNDRIALVDVPHANMLHLLENALNIENKNLSDLTDIIISHHDPDHMGCLFEIKERFPNINIIAHYREADYISGKKKSLRLSQLIKLKQTADSIEKARIKRFMERIEATKPVEVDTTVKDGEKIPGFEGLIAVLTPGHMPWHLSIYDTHNRLFIAGDALIEDEDRLSANMPGLTLEPSIARKAIKKLLKYDITAVLCYHTGVYKKSSINELRAILQEELQRVEPY